MVEVADKSILPGNADDTPKADDNAHAGAAKASRIETADKSTKDSKKVRLGESGGITF